MKYLPYLIVFFLTFSCSKKEETDPGLTSEETIDDFKAQKLNFDYKDGKQVKVATRTIKEAEQSIQQVLQDENRKLNEAIAEIQGNQGSMTQGQFMQVLQTEAGKLQKNLAKKERELRKESSAKIKDAERRRDREIKAKQESIQRLSVFLPPLPLLIIALIVFYRKKKAEIQGAYSSRVRS